MTVAAFDHVAIPTARPEEMLRFYHALGFTVPTLEVAPIEEGPVERVGGRNEGRAVGRSIYTRDPDDNLLEFIVYDVAV